LTKMRWERGHRSPKGRAHNGSEGVVEPVDVLRTKPANEIVTSACAVLGLITAGRPT
jgi:hypothetical protein